MRPAVSLVMLAACGRIGFDPSTQDATTTPDAAPLGPWGTPHAIPTFVAGFDYDDPGISPDGLELYVASTAGATEDIYVSRRQSRSDPWPAPTSVPGMDTAATEKAPELTGDGLSLYFYGGGDIKVATRTALDQPWSIASTGVTVAAVGTPAVCGNDLVMFVRIGNGDTDDIYRSTRTSTADPWSPPALVTELSSSLDDSGPWLTPNCGRVYFDSNRTAGHAIVYRADFDTATGTFAAPSGDDALHAQVDDIHDVSLTVDERYMVFSRNVTGFYQIWETSR